MQSDQQVEETDKPPSKKIPISGFNLRWHLARPLLSAIDTKCNMEGSAEDLGLDLNKPILYVLRKSSFIDWLVLAVHCRRLKLPFPHSKLDPQHLDSSSYTFIQKTGFFSRLKTSSPDKTLGELISKCPRPEDLQIVPITTIWGKNPGRTESSLMRLMFSDDENAGSFQKFFIVLAQGRNSLVHFGQPFRLASITDEDKPLDQQARKLKRLLRVHFQRVRGRILGQKLYIRDNIIRRITKSRAVTRIAEQELQKKGVPVEKSLAKARKYAEEIAADMNYSVVKFLEMILKRLWYRIFDGIHVFQLHHVTKLIQQDYSIIYFAAHRSHLDYLLVNYSLVRNGLANPHTASGINLNFFPLGPILRKGGAFFLRRSFGKDKLYSTVFSEYVHYLVTHGYNISFFPEGGRSRNGLTRPPKYGLLGMILNSFVQAGVDRKVALVPVYIGYDKVIEVASYLRELGGKPKKGESFRGFLKSFKLLKHKYGQAYLAFGEPVKLDRLFTELDMQPVKSNERPPWLNELTKQTASQLMHRINQAAVVNSVNIVAFALLASDRKAQPENDLLAHVEQLLNLAQCVNPNSTAYLKPGQIKQVLPEVERLNAISRFQHSAGDVIWLTESQAISLSYYRNNIIHIFLIPSLIAKICIQSWPTTTASKIQLLVGQAYGILKDEYQLSWQPTEVEHITSVVLKYFEKSGHITVPEELDKPITTCPSSSNHLIFLADSLNLVWQRYGIIYDLLFTKLDSHDLTEGDIERRCNKMSQKLAILNGLNHPESGEKVIFGNHIERLKSQGILTPTEKGTLEIHPRVSHLADLVAMLKS